MKNLKHIFLNFTLYILLCTSLSYSQGTWTQKANVYITQRAAASGFSIGNKGYIGCGWQDTLAFYLFDDFWEWDQGSNIWTQKANFPGGARCDAVAFSIVNKGYILTGQISGGVATNELWEWDQATNTWSQKAMFPGIPRTSASGFSIGLKGYVGFGDDINFNTLNDFWEYDQVFNIWTQRTNIPISRSDCASFSVGNMGYICTGLDVNSNCLDDLWEFNSALNTWTQKANFPGGIRAYASGFSIGNKGYVGTGWNGMNSVSDFWCFDPVLNLWAQKTSYPHSVSFNGHSGFSIECKGYFGTGAYVPAIGSNTFYNDFWEYEPDTCSLTGINEAGDKSPEMEVFPNPFSEKLNISVNSNELSEIIIYDMNSKKVFCKNFAHSVSIDTKSFAKGIYIYEVKNKNRYLKRGKVFKD